MRNLNLPRLARHYALIRTKVLSESARVNDQLMDKTVKAEHCYTQICHLW